MTDGIQKTDIHLNYIFFLILHRATRKTITFKMVLAGLKSVDEKYANSNLKSAHPRLLSIGDDDCASPPCDSPGRYGRYGYPGEDTDMDTTRGRRWSCTYQKDTIWVQLQLPTWSRWVTMVPHRRCGGSLPRTWHRRALRAISRLAKCVRMSLFWIRSVMY